MSFNLNVNRGFTQSSFSYDSRQIDKLVRDFAEDAHKQMEDAIFQILKKQLPKTQRYIVSELPPSSKDMGHKVADSLEIELLKSREGEVEFRFGSSPMDEEGVTGSRGGKLALYLQHGVGPFNYGFTFKTIESTRYWGGGEGFINAKAGKNTVHKGFKKISWLEHAQDGALPEIEAAILENLYEEWGA